MLTVACVEWGDYLGRGVEYVDKLRRMVARNMNGLPYHFRVFTDSIERHVVGAPRGLLPNEARRSFTRLESGQQGWWNKVQLFRPEAFDAGERVLFLDLDVVITEHLGPLTETKGIIHLRDWGWEKNDYGSGVMVWDAGEHSEIFERFTSAVPHCFRGDQDWLTHLGGWDALSPMHLRSYRYHCRKGIPKGCLVVSFHGNPKPHELLDWAELWQ